VSSENTPPRLFRAATYDTPRGPLQTYYMNASDRIDAVRRINDVDQLHEALEAPGIQCSVTAAIKRRLKELEKACPE